MKDEYYPQSNSLTTAAPPILLPDEQQTIEALKQTVAELREENRVLRMRVEITFTEIRNLLNADMPEKLAGGPQRRY